MYCIYIYTPDAVWERRSSRGIYVVMFRVYSKINENLPGQTKLKENNKCSSQIGEAQEKDGSEECECFPLIDVIFLLKKLCDTP